MVNARPRDFRLQHPCGLLLEPQLDEQRVQTVDDVVVTDMGNGYVWYRLPKAEIAGQTIAMQICFQSHTLETLNVAVVDPDLYGSSWATWSAEKERARAKATRRWLAAIGYPVGDYPWGTVSAGTDPKTGDGSGIIRLSAQRPLDRLNPR